MSISIVNGYVCFNCTDTERAGKGQDPANPAGDPAKETSPVKASNAAAAKDGQPGAWSAYSDGSSGVTSTAVSPSGAILLPGLGGRADVFA